MNNILFDLDGTLAVQESGVIDKIGSPINSMITLLKMYLDAGYDVRIFTARVSVKEEEQYQREIIDAWCLEHIGQKLPVQNYKDLNTVAIYDDRAYRVVKNTGLWGLSQSQEEMIVV